jgi:putative ABC transport system substrate-binding protein
MRLGRYGSIVGILGPPGLPRDDPMKRCEYITLIGGATAWPIAARARQPERMRRIGVLLPAVANDAQFQAWIGAFLQGLAPLGWTIGRVAS